MSQIIWFFNFVIHLDMENITWLIGTVGIWIYLLMFLVIFCETGLVVTPFLPGDSLIFALSAVAAATGSINMVLMTFVLIIAAILGNIVNYQIGRFVGPKIFSKEKVRFLNKEHLIKTQNFYDKHGGKTIIITRFMPIIRTFAPFVAGVGRMKYMKFMLYNAIGGVAWVLLFVAAGTIIFTLPGLNDRTVVEKYFTYIIYGIVIVSLLPAIIGYISSKVKSAKSKKAK